MDTYLYPRPSQPLLVKRILGSYQWRQLCYGCMYNTTILGGLLMIYTWQMRFRRNTRLLSHYAPLPAMPLLMLLNNPCQLASSLIGRTTPSDLWDCGHTKGCRYGGMTDWLWGKLWNENSVRWLQYCHRLSPRSPNQYRLYSTGLYTIKGHPMDSMINT